MKKNFSFNVIINCPWPIILSFRLFELTRTIFLLIILNIINTTLIIIFWFCDIIRDRIFYYKGLHTFFIINF